MSRLKQLEGQRLYRALRFLFQRRGFGFNWTNHDTSFFDGKDVHVIYSVQRPYLREFTEAECRIIRLGHAYHEVGHVLFDHLPSYREWLQGNATKIKEEWCEQWDTHKKYPASWLQFFGNFGLDGRMENLQSMQFPFTKDYHDFINYNWINPVGHELNLGQSPLNDFRHMYSHRVLGMNDYTTWHPEVVDLINANQHLIDDLRIAASTKECLKIVSELMENVWPKILEWFEEEQQEPSDNPNEYSDDMTQGDWGDEEETTANAQEVVSNNVNEDSEESGQSTSNDDSNDDSKGDGQGTSADNSDEDSNEGGQGTSNDDSDEDDSKENGQGASDDDSKDDDSEEDGQGSSNGDSDEDSKDDGQENDDDSNSNDNSDNNADSSNKPSFDKLVRAAEKALKADQEIVELEEQEDGTHTVTYGNSMGEAKVTTVPALNPPNYDKYVQFHNEVKRDIPRLARELERILEPEPEKKRRYQRRGKLMTHAVWRAMHCDDQNVYRNTKPGTPADSAFLGFMADISGSTGQNGAIEQIRLALTLMLSATTKAKVPSQAYAFTSDYHGTFIARLKERDLEFTEKNKESIGGLHACMGNRDAVALRYLLDICRKRTENIRVAVMISDGAPNFYDDENEQTMKDMVNAAVKEGIEVLCLFVGNDEYGLEVAKQIYGDRVIHAKNGLVAGMQRHITKILAARRR